MGLFKFLFSAKNASMEEFGVIIDNEFIYRKEKESKKISKQSISKITLKYGFFESPFTIFKILAMGILWITITSLFSYHIELNNFISFRGVKVLFYMTLIFFSGICICVSGFSMFYRCFFLEILVNSGIERIDFPKGAEKSRIDNLLNHARNLGYPIFCETDEIVTTRSTQ
jgi:hypothetical protein